MIQKEDSQKLIVNLNCTFAGDDRMGDEFKYIEKHLRDENGKMKKGLDIIEKHLRDENGKMKKGLDIGCGTNRLSQEVLSLDQNPMRKFAHADVVHDCANLNIGKPVTFNGLEYKFEDGEFDFIFSAHCLEDFDNIPAVFMNWWKKLKVGGLLISLLPDMEICNCELCQSEEQKEYRKNNKQSARYWTLEDYKETDKGNPAHKTNVGKKFMTDMLQKFKEKDQLNYEMIQMDTIPHNKGCSIDFVIKKLS